MFFNQNLFKKEQEKKENESKNSKKKKYEEDLNNKNTFIFNEFNSKENSYQNFSLKNSEANIRVIIEKLKKNHFNYFN